MTTLLLLVALSASPTPPTALETLATRVAQALPPALEAPVGIHVEGAPAPFERAFASLLAARLAALKREPVVIDAKDATAAESLARARGVKSLVRLSLEADARRALARGDAISTHVNFWSGAAPTRSGPAIAIAEAVESDAQVLALLGAPAPKPVDEPLTLTVSTLAVLPKPPAALLAADLDGDGQAEVIALVGGEVVAFDGRGKQRWRAVLSTPSAAVACRDDFGALDAHGTNIEAWLAGREGVQTFTGAGMPNGTTGAVTSNGLTLLPVPGVNAFQPAVTRDGKPELLSAPIQSVSRRGDVLLLTHPDGGATLSQQASSGTRLGGVGAGSSLADVDGDGVPEVVVTTTRTTGDADEVRVLPLAEALATSKRGGTATEVTPAWRGTITGRALSAVAGSLDGDGRESVVLGVSQPDGTGALLLLRGARP